MQAWAEHGLKRGCNDLRVHATCEIPDNVVQIAAFGRLFDGFSIGSNDLTQLVLAVDRDSPRRESAKEHSMINQPVSKLLQSASA